MQLGFPERAIEGTITTGGNVQGPAVHCWSRHRLRQEPSAKEVAGLASIHSRPKM
jgi:hypothetical protein